MYAPANLLTSSFVLTATGGSPQIGPTVVGTVPPVGQCGDPEPCVGPDLEILIARPISQGRHGIDRRNPMCWGRSSVARVNE